MQILILNWRDIHHPLAGGAEISLFEHAKYWKKKGAEVVWFSSSYKNAKPNEEIEGVSFIRKGSMYTVHIFAFLYFVAGKLGKPHFVIDSFHFIPFFTPLYIKKNTKIVALINEVAGILWFTNLSKPLAAIGFLLEPSFFKFYKTQSFITSSQSTRDELIQVGIDKKYIELIPHGVSIVNINRKIKRESKPTILFLGRVSKDKGIYDVIDTFRNVKIHIKDVNLWIVGKEEKQGMVKKILNNSAKDITYFGFVSEKKKFELYKRAWVLLNASKKEGWGLTVIEAGRVGTPTIGYNVAGLKDSIIHNKTGILAEIHPNLLSESIIKLLEDRKLYNTLSKNAQDWSKKFNWEEAGKKSFNHLKKLSENE